MLLLAIGLLACSDYDLKRGDDVAGEDTAGGGGATEQPPTGGDPSAAMEGSAHLVSGCGGEASDVLYIYSVGGGDLTVSEVSVVSASGGSLSATPAEALPATVPPGESLEVLLSWSPEGSEAFYGELYVRTDDPALDTALTVTGEVLDESTAPEVTLSVPECASVLLGDPVTLEATAWDAESAPQDLYAVWESDVDGVLQEGWLDIDGTSALSLTPSQGLHTVTVTVTDTCGVSSAAATTLDITDTRGQYPGSEPDGLGFDDRGYLWIADYGSDRVYQVETLTLGIIKELALPYSGADGVTWMDGQMLVSFYQSNQVVAIDPCTGAETGSFPAPGSGVSDVSWDGSGLWLTDYTTKSIYKVDPATGAVLDYFSAPFSYPNGLAWDGASFWLTANSTTKRIARLDTSFQVIEDIAFSGSDPRGVAWDGERIWYSDASLWRVDVLWP